MASEKTRYKVAQFRFYGEGSPNNSPQKYLNKDDGKENNVNKASYVNGSVFSNVTAKLKEEGSRIVQLGVQSLPGTIFYLDDAQHEYPIVVGHTGIFELDLTESLVVIEAISFDSRSINIIDSNPTAYLLVDVIYDREG